MTFDVSRFRLPSESDKWIPTDDPHMVLVHNPDFKMWAKLGWYWDGLEYSMIGNRAYWTMIESIDEN